MLSYAQNLEDVVLARLGSLIPVGRFVDVGAGHPVLDNVTYALYRTGWRGVNVEPMEREVRLLRSQRPEDTTIQAAVGAAPGRMTLYAAPLENRGATTADVELVARYEATGQHFEPFEVEVLTLESVLAGFEPGSVHVLKIDVEGMEARVIAGAALEQTRPWVLVIEATAPNTPHDTSALWEGAVLSAGYTCTLFDGLNRFYVHRDRDDLSPLLSVPANVFDGWQRHTEVEARAQAEALERELAKVVAARETERSNAERAIAEALDRFKRADTYAKSLEVERERSRALIEALRTEVAELSAQLPAD